MIAAGDLTDDSLQSLALLLSLSPNFILTENFVEKGEQEIRKEFSKLDTDNSGYITKGQTSNTLCG